MAFLVTENDIGRGLTVIATPGTAGAIVEADLGFGLSFNGNKIDAAAPMPNGAIGIVKAGLTGTATANVNLEMISTIATYAWSGLGVSFASPAAATSAYTVLAVGAYEITLTVTTDKGIIATFTRTVKHDYRLDVLGHDSEMMYFASLADAWAWITANDLANGGNYTVDVMGETSDSGVITAPAFNTLVSIHSGGDVKGGIDYGSSGTHRLVGQDRRYSTISGGNGTPTILSTGASVNVYNLRVDCPDATQHTIDVSGALSIYDSNIGSQSSAADEVLAVRAISAAQTNFTIVNTIVTGQVHLKNRGFNPRAGCIFIGNSPNATYGVWIDSCTGSLDGWSFLGTTASNAAVGNHAALKITKGGNSLYLQNFTFAYGKSCPAGSYVATVYIDGATPSVLSINGFTANNVGAAAGSNYGIVRNGAGQANEYFADSYFRQKTNAAICLIAGVASAWTATIHGCVFAASDVHPLVTYTASTASGTNIKI